MRLVVNSCFAKKHHIVLHDDSVTIISASACIRVTGIKEGMMS